MYQYGFLGFPAGVSGKTLPVNEEDIKGPSLILELKRSPEKKGMATLSAFLPGESYGQRSLMGVST